MYYTKIFKYYGNNNLCHIIDLQSWITAILSALMTDTVLSSSFKHAGQKGGKEKKKEKEPLNLVQPLIRAKRSSAFF